MLKKDNWLELKQFVAFMEVFQVDCNLKIVISKKLLEFCDVRGRDQKIGIS
jgi:hypothetical protein